MPLVPDQSPVQQFASASLHPPLHGRVHSRDPNIAENKVNPRIGKDGIEKGGELPIPVPDQEPRQAARVLKVHEVAGRQGIGLGTQDVGAPPCQRQHQGPNRPGSARSSRTLGHEAVGVVQETGPGVARVRPGDHVALFYVPSSGF